MKNWKEVEEYLLGEPKDIVVISHPSPDGDSIGSSLGLYHWLKTKGHQITVITPDPAPHFLKWLNGFEQIINYKEQEKEVETAVSSAEIICCLDFNSLGRLREMQEVVKKNTSAFLINIDHHRDPEDFAHFQLSDATASSTAQLVYQFTAKLDGTAWMDLAFANCIYTGILTDTGSFRFSYTSAETHTVAAHLLELGVKSNEIYEAVFDNYTSDRLKLLGYALNNSLFLYPAYKTAIIALTEKELQQFNYKKGDTEGLVNYPLSVEEVKMSILITEGDGKVKLSFRSKGDFKVNEIANKYFNGGGHLNAAGGISDVNVEETRKKLEKIIVEYEAALNQ